MLRASEVAVTWEIDGAAGTYRFQYYGDSKAPFTGSIHEFTGTSSRFEVT